MKINKNKLNDLFIKRIVTVIIRDVEAEAKAEVEAVEARLLWWKRKQKR